MRVRSLGFRTDLMVRRLADSEITDRGDHIVVRSPAAPNFYWGNFLLLSESCDLKDPEVWLDRFSDNLPAARHVAIGWNGTSTRALPGLEGLTTLGMELDLGTVMTAPQLLPPEGAAPRIAVRRLSSESEWRALHRLEEELWAEENRDAPGYLEFLTSRVAETRRLSEGGRGACFGVFEGDRLVSTAGVVCANRVARFQNVETRPDRRRRGLAGAVVAAAGAFSRERLGAGLLVIVADPAGPAISLYRRLGFQETEPQISLLRVPQ